MISREEAMLQCYQVPGQMWPTELGWLFDTFRDSSRHVEIGTYCGRSLLATCLGMQTQRTEVISVDVDVQSPIGRSWVAGVRQLTFDQIQATTGIRVEWIELLSIDAARLCGSRRLVFDSVFIDADHHYAECRADVEVWSQLTRPGGIISGHDYWPVDSGVMEAVNEVLGGRFQVVPGTRIWYARI